MSNYYEKNTWRNTVYGEYVISPEPYYRTLYGLHSRSHLSRSSSREGQLRDVGICPVNVSRDLPDRKNCKGGLGSGRFMVTCKPTQSWPTTAWGSINGGRVSYRAPISQSPPLRDGSQTDNATITHHVSDLRRSRF